MTTRSTPMADIADAPMDLMECPWYTKPGGAQVVCCLRRIDALETAVTAGTARASAARAGTALAGIIVAIVVVMASTATACSRRPPQGFGTLQQPGRSCKIARSDGLLEFCVLSRAADGLESSLKDARRSICSGLEENREAGRCLGWSRRKRSGKVNGARARRTSWREH